MPALPKASLVALALVSTLAGCGSDNKAATPSPTASSSETSVTPPIGTPSSTPNTSASAEPEESPTSAECRASKAIPDGTWRGPITAEIRGDGEQTGYADSRGTGQLTMTVHNGTVSSGSWNLTWKSHGEVDTGQAAATVDFTGKVTGTATGSAAKPHLVASWKIDGIAKVSKPQQMSSPFDETGGDKGPMTIKSSTCAQVTGTFTPVVVSKETAATFTGPARWIGTRQ